MLLVGDAYKHDKLHCTLLDLVVATAVLGKTGLMSQENACSADQGSEESLHLREVIHLA